MGESDPFFFPTQITDKLEQNLAFLLLHPNNDSGNESGYNCILFRKAKTASTVPAKCNFFNCILLILNCPILKSKSDLKQQVAELTL